MSSSKAFGAFLSTSESFHNAIIVPEPDYLIESLPYYVHNAIYLPREHVFRTTVSWTTDADRDLSLGELLSVAQDIRAQYGRPVLVVLGHLGVDELTFGKINFSYGKTFQWSAEERADASRRLVPVAEFISAVGDENYKVYAIK
jgi:hypothetical protein